MNQKNLSRLAALILMAASSMTASAAFAQDAISAARPVLQQETHALWGGSGISVEVITLPATAAHSAIVRAEIKLDCGAGLVESVVKDGHGGFLGFGFLNEKSLAHVGVAMPAHFMGIAQNGAMTMMIVADSDPGHPEVYFLKKGEVGHLSSCR